MVHSMQRMGIHGVVVWWSIWLISEEYLEKFSEEFRKTCKKVLTKQKW